MNDKVDKMRWDQENDMNSIPNVDMSPLWCEDVLVKIPPEELLQVPLEDLEDTGRKHGTKEHPWGPVLTFNFGATPGVRSDPWGQVRPLGSGLDF